jgi:Acetyltransferase (GNAT) domain
MILSQDNTFLVDDIQYALLDDACRNEVIDFYNNIYNTTRTRQNFDWLMDGPAGKTVYVIARDTKKNNQIVGSQCAIPIFMTNNLGNKVLTAKSDDTLVDPAYRGRKIFKYMYELLFDICHKAEIEYIWGFTDAEKPFKAVGFETPYSICKSYFMVSVGDAFRYMISSNPNDRLHNLKALPFVLLGRIKSVKRFFLDKKLTKFSVESLWTDDLDGLIQSYYNAHKELFFIPFKQQNYLEWRILNAQGVDRYKAFALRDVDKILRGYIVFSMDAKNVAHLMFELYDEKLSEADILSFLSHSIKCVADEKVAMIKTWNFDTNAYNKKTMSRHSKVGFWHVREGMSLVWKKLDHEKLMEANNINFNLLASFGI